MGVLMAENPYIKAAFDRAEAREKKYIQTTVLPVLLKVKTLPAEIWQHIASMLCTENTVRINMLIMRRGLFYKNSLLIFQCTRAYMLKSFEDMQPHVKKIQVWGESDLEDHPLHTFCMGNSCEETRIHKCCSAWDFHDFALKAELLASTEKFIYSFNGVKDITYYEN
jgi:hypothetical protein